MCRFLLWVFAVIGVIMLLAVAIVGGGVWYVMHDDGPATPRRMTLTLDFRQPIAGGPRKRALRQALDGAPATLHDTIEAIDLAARDVRVTALGGVFGEIGRANV